MIVSPGIESAIQQKLIYSSAELLPNDWDDAFYKWLPLAEAGNAKAQFNIGYCYDHGKGADFDIQQAIEWYEKAASQNAPRAFRNLGFIFWHKDFLFNNSFCELVPREFIDFNADVEKAKQYFAQGISLGDEVSMLANNTILLTPGIEEFEKGNKSGAKTLFQNLVDEGYECGCLGLIACDIEIDAGSFRQTYAPSPADLLKIMQLKFIVRNNSNWGANIKYHLFIHEADKMLFSIASANEKIPAKGMLKLSTRHHAEFDIITLADLVIKYEDGFFRDFSANVYFQLNNNPASPTTYKVNKESAAGCFVVTACMGSEDNNTVTLFRQFRDNTLTKYSAGRSFISWYYRNGPLMAEWISSKPLLRKFCGRMFVLMSKLL